MGTSSLNQAYGVSRKTFQYLAATASSEAWFESEVMLPVGTKITKIAASVNSAGGGSVQVELWRMNLGHAAEELEALYLAGVLLNEWYYSSNPDPLARVTAGTKYWVRVRISDDDAAVHGVKVLYR